jgi:uncharacterized protein YecE (DUF72 family)
VEVDSTFYRFPAKSTVFNWKRTTPKDFVFSLKFPQVITHIKKLENCQKETKAFLKIANLFGEKLGCLLLQLPPSFTIKNFSSLETFLELLPRDRRFALEVRHESLLNIDLYRLLRRYKVALAWVDSASMPLTLEVTADFLYLRWEGDRKKVNGLLGKVEVNREADVRVWAEKVKSLMESYTVYGYFSKYFSGYSVGDALFFLKLLKVSRS